MKVRNPLRIGLLALISFALLILICTPTRTPLVQIEAKTRHIEFKAVNDAFSVIGFPEAVSLTLSTDSSPECAIGTLMPPANSVVSYDVYRDTLIISSDKPMSFIRKSELQPQTIAIGGTISIGPESTCHLDNHSPIKLPIWGPATVGKRPMAATTSQGKDVFNGLFLSGNSTIYGRNLFGSGLYSAGSLALPAGSQLSTASFENKNGTAPSWFGYAIFNPQSQNSEITAIKLSASVETRQLRFLRVGTENPQSKINIGFFTKVTKDPVLSGLGGFLLLCFVACEFLVALITLRDWAKS